MTKILSTKSKKKVTVAAREEDIILLVNFSGVREETRDAYKNSHGSVWGEVLNATLTPRQGGERGHSRGYVSRYGGP